MLGFQSYWDAAYADELANFREHGHTGEIWFGGDVMENVVSWTKGLCMDICKGHLPNHVADADSEPVGRREKDMSSWSVLDIGTGNGLLLQELAKQGFSDLTGTDYSEGAVDLARSLADRDGFTNVKFLVDDILETKLDKSWSELLHYFIHNAVWSFQDYVLGLCFQACRSWWIIVITSCNNTKDELVEEVETLNQRRNAACQEPGLTGGQEASVDPPPFRYLDHVRTYPTFTFGGSVGSRVATVAS
ncbi:hypothetical protein HAX54_031636 [Datura stramonium]|uniref:Methyltransferase domain-containing protein n=1 Tax=Datura stramonium TaxID=4076 RepID=A0ABS8SC13_DATST|nr:hypothetical protein [Datura stramonium]